MRRCRALSWHALLLALAANAGAGSDSPLVGRWELVGQEYELIIELREDGSYVAHTAMGVTRGRWQSVDGASLSTWNSEGKPPRVSRFELDGDTLIIIDPDGPGLVHRRVVVAPATQ